MPQNTCQNATKCGSTQYCYHAFQIKYPFAARDKCISHPSSTVIGTLMQTQKISCPIQLLQLSMVQNVDTHKPLSLYWVVPHNQVFCFHALIVNVELELVCVVPTNHIFLDDMFENSLICLVFGVHVVTVVQVMSTTWYYMSTFISLAKTAMFASYVPRNAFSA